MIRVLTLFALFIALVGCSHRTIPPSESLVSQDEVTVTGVGYLDAQLDYPITADQTYPQVRLRAYEQAIADARSQVLTQMSAQVLNGGVLLGDMIDQHPQVEEHALAFVDALETDPPRWHWDDGEVEVDIKLQEGELQQFITSIPIRYLYRTRPTVQHSLDPMTSSDIQGSSGASLLPQPTSNPIPLMTSEPASPSTTE